MELMDFLGKFLELAALALLPVLAAFIAGYLRVKGKEILADLENRWPEQLSVVSFVVKQVVLAAEQAGAAGLIDDKKAYALGVATDWLAGLGLDIDLDVIEAAIEAAVKKEFNGK